MEKILSPKKHEISNPFNLVHKVISNICILKVFNKK